MVSHSLNLFWFADVYPTVSHKNCPKKKKSWDLCIGRVPLHVLWNFHDFNFTFLNLKKLFVYIYVGAAREAGGLREDLEFSALSLLSPRQF